MEGLYLVALVATPLLSFLIALLATPGVRRLAIRYGFQDHPSPRREGVLKPRLGGLALYLAFGGTIAITAPLVANREPEEMVKVMGLLAGASLVVVMGSLDDRRELGVAPQLAVQVAAAAVAMVAGVVIDKVANPLGVSLADSVINLPLYLTIGFTMMWMLGAMNAINFVDGIDGLAGGIGAIAAIVLFIHSFRLGQYTVALLPLALAGSVVGFLPYNFSPAKITLGTSGAVFLGFTLAALSVIGGTKAATLLLVLGIPIIDAGWIILQRVYRRRSPFRPDRSHLHHRLLEMGLSSRQTVTLFYFLCGTLGVLALLLSSRLMKLYTLLGLGVLLAGILAIVAQKSLAGKS
ncbi:MAG: undecaprenyl/decaprenyl-phosphate alpha-N-acetylglucosaminyl 1-phosphate transferase [Chloroflexi bacterium]|nr:undecaprenyl/decaprenyl-phosphate alpha-N-acetylglucosaminyl 1-phosphate transferase [Chloroflexota bacterium]